MELLRDQFDQAFTNVDLGIRVQVAKAAQEEVRTYLGGRAELKLFGFRTTLIGSYPRHTAIWPGKDVDIFGKFDGLSVEDATPGQVYEAVLRALCQRYVPSFPIDTKRCATLGEPHCLHEAGRGWNSQDWPCRVDSAVSHSRTNISMTTRSCENGCAPFYVPLSF